MSIAPETTPTPESAPPPRRPGQRGRRAVAAAAAVALVGGGAFVGHAAVGAAQPDTTSASGSAQQNTAFGGTSGSTGSGDGFGEWQQQLQDQQSQQGQQGQQAQPQLPSSPFGSGPGLGSGGGASSSSTAATGDQITGLVRIQSTLGYVGGEGAGTGLVLTSDGEVVTNHHVVEGSTKLDVTVMSTGKTYAATVVGSDKKSDIAVIKLQGASGLATVTADEDPVSVGDATSSVGDGDGTADSLSVVEGKVLAKAQTITTSSEGTVAGQTLRDLIEVSSDVIPGYSGGATYDDEGEVLGMTVAASSGTQDPVGYAIPIATVLRVADDLENGVQGSDYTYGKAAFLGVGLADGTTVQGVYDGTPASKAGIAAGDTITSLGGVRVDTATQLKAAVASHSPGDRVKVTWTDGSGSSQSATVTLTEGPVG